MAGHFDASQTRQGEIPSPSDAGSALSSARGSGRSTLRQRFILGVLALLAAIVLLMAGELLSTSHRQAMRVNDLSLARRSLMLADSVSWAFNSTILAQHLFIDYLRAMGLRNPDDFDSEGRKPEITEHLIDHGVMIPQQLNTILINNDGIFINGAISGEQIGMSVADRDYFQEFKRDPGWKISISQIAKARITSQAVVRIAQPVRSSDGTPLGVIVTGFASDYFEQLFNVNRPIGGGTVAVYRFDGSALLNSSVGDPAAASVDVKASLADFLRTGANTAVVAVPGGEGGAVRLVSFHKLDGQPMVVAVSAQTKSLLRDWRREAWILGAAAALIEGIILCVAVLVTSLARADRKVLAERDVKELAEQRELASARELESLIRTIPGLVSRRRRRPDGSWQCLFISSNVGEVAGFDPADVVKPGWLEGIIGPDQHKLLCEHLDSALVEGRASLDLTFRLPSGKLRKAHAEIGRVGADENATDVSVIWTDVTVERSLSAQLAQAAKLATLGEVATGLAHELSQPLATILLAAENAINMLDRTPLDRDRMLGKLEMITGMSGRTASLLDHMRVFGRTDDGSIAALSLQDVAMRAGVLLARRLTSAAVTLKTDFPLDLPRVWAKEVPLEQVLINIVSNACDAYALAGEAIPQDRRLVVIKGEHDLRGQRVIVSVQDKAGGIAEDALPYVFEQFFTTKPADQGTGLGLSINRRAISDMGGSIWAENRDGGAVFFFTLPVANSREN